MRPSRRCARRPGRPRRSSGSPDRGRHAARPTRPTRAGASSALALPLGTLLQPRNRRELVPQPHERLVEAQRGPDHPRAAGHPGWRRRSSAHSRRWPPTASGRRALTLVRPGRLRRRAAVRSAAARRRSARQRIERLERGQDLARAASPWRVPSRSQPRVEMHQVVALLAPDLGHDLGQRREAGRRPAPARRAASAVSYSQRRAMVNAQSLRGWSSSRA